MKLIIDIEKDYYEMIKYNVEHGQDYKPFEIIANGIPYEEGSQGEWKEDAFSYICPFCGMTIEDEVRYLYPDNFDLNFCPNCGKKLRWKGEEE